MRVRVKALRRRGKRISEYGTLAGQAPAGDPPLEWVVGGRGPHAGATRRPPRAYGSLTNRSVPAGFSVFAS